MAFYIEGFGVLDYTEAMIFSRSQSALIKFARHAGEKLRTERISELKQETLVDMLAAEKYLMVKLALTLENGFPTALRDTLRETKYLRTTLWAGGAESAEAIQPLLGIDPNILEELKKLLRSSSDQRVEEEKEDIAHQLLREEMLFLFDLPPLPQALQQLAHFLNEDVHVEVRDEDESRVFLEFRWYRDILFPTTFLSYCHMLLYAFIKKARGE